MRVYILIETKMVTNMTQIILHIVCWYPVLSGSMRLLVTPGGGGLAGIVVGSLMFAEVWWCLDHEKASRKGRTKDRE